MIFLCIGLWGASRSRLRDLPRVPNQPTEKQPENSPVVTMTDWKTKPTDRFVLRWIKLNLSARITPWRGPEPVGGSICGMKS